MIQDFLGLVQGMFIPGMKGREAVKVGILVEHPRIPFIEALRNALPMGVIGIDDSLDAVFAQVLDALAMVELMEDVPTIIPGEKLPDGVAHSVRKQMDVEIDSGDVYVLHELIFRSGVISA